MSSYIFEQVEEAARQAREYAFVHELRHYIPQRYDISVDVDMFGDCTMLIGEKESSYIELTTEDEVVTKIIVGNKDGALVKHGEFVLEELANNFEYTFELLEQGAVDEALTALTQQ